MNSRNNMPVYTYKEGEHSSGFVGIRVVVGGLKKQQQKHYSFKNASPKKIKKLEKRAKKLEVKWQQLQQKSFYSTGVRGIRMNFIIIRKIIANEERNYYTPVFVVSGQSDGKNFCKRFNIIKHGYKQAWENAVKYYANKKGFSNYDSLIKPLPPMKNFLSIVKVMRKTDGHKVPNKRLPLELQNTTTSI